MSRDVVELENTVCLKETDMALLCRLETGQEVWIPKSQVDDASEVLDDDDNDRGTLVVTAWIATEKGLV
jgi:hypothetical protein